MTAPAFALNNAPQETLGRLKEGLIGPRETGRKGGNPSEETMTTSSRCGFVALIGEPNAGKSSLTNALVGTKIAIVTHKVQTTRARLRGIATEGKAQLIINDTPGLFRPKRKFDRAMVAAAWGAAAEADVILLLIEAHRGLTPGVNEIIARLKVDLPPGTVVALVINKIDRVRPPKLLELAAAANALYPFSRTFMISATTGSGVADLKRWLAEAVPEGPWHYPEDQIADAPLRWLAAEATREKAMLRLHDELPYELTVETESWQDRPDGSVRIEQVISVAREGHRKIVLGAGGQTIKAIGQAARADIAALLGKPVHLFLFVKVRERWMDDPEHLRALGLDVDGQ